MFFKTLILSIFSLLSFSNSIIPLPDNFALDLIQSNFQLLQLTFNNPENSFGVIIDPIQRLEFLQSMTNSLNELTDSLALINGQIGISLDSVLINTINGEINSMMNGIANRASQYLLPLNVSQIQINPEFIIFRLNSTVNNMINNVINIPIIQGLNRSLVDLSVQNNAGIDSYPNKDILASLDTILLKISDLEGNLVQTQLDLIIYINDDICPFVEDCNLYCGIWNDITGLWVTVPSVAYDLHQVSCKIPSNLKTSQISIQQAEFFPVAVFSENVDSNEMTPLLISFFCISGLIFTVMVVFAVNRYKRKKLRIYNNSSTGARYNSISVV